MNTPSKKCIICGLIFYNLRFNKKGQRIRKYTKEKWEKAKFCSPVCYWKSLDGSRGEKTPRWKPELHKEEKVLCACGCGTLIPKRDKKFRLAKYVNGHTARGKKRPELREQFLKIQYKHKGENHWNWKGGKTSENHRLRNSPRYKKWRLKVYARDHYTCKDCDTHCTSKTIVAHHLKSFNDYPKLRYRVSNGLTVCRKCHKKIHKDIGLETRFKKNID